MKFILNKTVILLLVLTAFHGCRDDEGKVFFEEVKAFTGDVVLSSQAELDDFTMKKYSTINGKLELRNEVNSLAGFLDLNEIIGDLIIINTDLTTLDGLDNLTKVTESIQILTQPPGSPQNITDFCALQSLFSSIDFNPNFVQIRDNVFNPSFQNIANGNCTQ